MIKPPLHFSGVVPREACFGKKNELSPSATTTHSQGSRGSLVALEMVEMCHVVVPQYETAF